MYDPPTRINPELSKYFTPNFGSLMKNKTHEIFKPKIITSLQRIQIQEPRLPQ